MPCLYNTFATFKANGLVAFSVGQRPTDRSKRQGVRGKNPIRAYQRNLRDKSTQNTGKKVMKNMASAQSARNAGLPQLLISYKKDADN